MAPKRGGSSSSGSSTYGGSCYDCSRTFILEGNDWTEAETNALFAFEIICLLVLLSCLVMAPRFKWVAKAGKHDVRKTRFVTATYFMILYSIIKIVDTALREEVTFTTYLYYIIYIFRSLSWRIGELLILATIIRQIYESLQTTDGNALRTFSKIAITFLTLLSLIGFGFYTSGIVNTITDGSAYSSDYDVVQAGNYVDFTYQALYFVMAIVVVIFSAFLFSKERSKAALIMVAVIAPSLFLRALMDLAARGVFNWPGNTTYDAYNNLMWANSFLLVFLISVIFLAVAFIGTLEPSNSNFVPQQKPNQTMVPMEYAQNSAPTAYQSNYYGYGTPHVYNNFPQNGVPVAPYGSAAPGAYHQSHT